MFEQHFLTANPESHAALARLLDGMREALRRRPDHAYSGQSPAALADLLALPGEAFERLADVAAHSINVNHANAIAHLHCPTLLPAIAAEMLIGALNPSLDSFDQAPAATVIELETVRELGALAGFPETSGGTFTPGATQSNFFGLLLAREAMVFRRTGKSCWEHGLSAAPQRLRILCSEFAHFSVEKSAAQLGLGTDAVVRVAGDERFRMSIPALESALDQLRRDGEAPMAIVATAGTTDFGSIDPLGAIARLAHSAGAWFHIDAAYGGALLFSEKHRDKLRGTEQADSVSLDFHKLLWQPVGCGAFLVRDADEFERIRMHAEYLNPEEHEHSGIPDLVTRSLLTSRRFDALKLWLSRRMLGDATLAAMVDHTLAAAEGIADFIAAQPRLHLENRPELGCVVFRFVPIEPADSDGINSAVRRELFDRGDAVIGQTRLRGRTCLKLTCLNPCTTVEQLQDLIGKIVATAIRLENRERLTARLSP